jgi:hypothetical protein
MVVDQARAATHKPIIGVYEVDNVCSELEEICSQLTKVMVDDSLRHCRFSIGGYGPSADHGKDQA